MPVRRIVTRSSISNRSQNQDFLLTESTVRRLIHTEPGIRSRDVFGMKMGLKGTKTD